MYYKFFAGFLQAKNFKLMKKLLLVIYILLLGDVQPNRM